VNEELQREWRLLVWKQTGAPCGYDTPAVQLFWEIVEHRMKCEVCRDEDIGRSLMFLLQTPPDLTSAPPSTTSQNLPSTVILGFNGTLLESRAVAGSFNGAGGLS
jgi:hypothetical protein